MFLDNKYTKIYLKITSSPDTTPYTEQHHIVPRSLGGSDESTNLVKLTARKHFICHYLLTKMLEPNSRAWHKMVRAFMMMAACSNNQQRYFNSKLYESQRVAFSQVISANQTGEGNSQFGTRWVHLGTQNFKIKGEDLQSYLATGYMPGQYKQPKAPKPVRVYKPKPVPKYREPIEERHAKERELLLPLLERFLNGESLRTLSRDYGKSHVSLGLRFKLHFADQLDSIKPRTNKRI